MSNTWITAAVALAVTAGLPVAAQSVAGSPTADTVSFATASIADAGLRNAFSASKAVAVNKLEGAVSRVSVHNLGNVANGSGAAAGGAAGTANGGSGSGGNGTGGAASSGDGSGGSGGYAGAGVGYGASVAGGGVGGSGGAGGTSKVDAGSLNLSNTMASAAKNAAGVVVISQNTGIGALTQQSINVQANIGLGK